MNNKKNLIILCIILIIVLSIATVIIIEGRKKPKVNKNVVINELELKVEPDNEPDPSFVNILMNMTNKAE